MPTSIIFPDLRTPAWSLDQIFHYVIEHLRKQGCRSVLQGRAICAYREAITSRMCAYGVFIPDEDYKPEFEHQRVAHIQSMFGYVAPAFRCNDKPYAWASDQHWLLAADHLQAAHDNSLNEIILNYRLLFIKQKYELSSFEPIAKWGK